MELSFMYPSYIDEIVDRLAKRGWLVHNFLDVSEGEIYNFSNYKYNKQVEGVTYTLFLDVNVYQFIVNSVKKGFTKDIYRDAIALVIFCQYPDIVIEPVYAVYEKINYGNDREKLDEVTRDLELFYRIDSSDSEELAQYVLGYKDKIEVTKLTPFDHDEMQGKLTKYKRLIDWDSLYLIMLYITFVSLDTSLSREQKLNKVVEWMIKEFRLSLVAITYASVFFGKKPLKKMMKFKSSQSSDERLRSLFNMTWDLYNLNRYFRMWTERGTHEEGLFASDDKVFNEILKYSISVQNQGDLSVFTSFLAENDVEYLKKITLNPEKYFSRKYNSEDWSPEYRRKLIEKYELELQICSKET